MPKTKRVQVLMEPKEFRALESLARKKAVIVREDVVGLFGREVQLDSASEELRSRIEEAYRTGRFQPPLLSELPDRLHADPAEVRRIYFWMIKERVLVKVTEDMAFHRSAVDEIKARITERFQAGARFGVAEFKDLFDLTRKHAIPLLEFLDRERFTRRQGNERVLM